jgi:tRNA modification GTPase
MNTDTIVAQASPIGKGGVGVVRISGPNVIPIAEIILGKVPRPRYAEYLPFKNSDGQTLDQGIALLFKNPNSFTGEDVLELQGHGGQVIVDMLIKACLATGLTRVARPGEFSERAFLNDKMDLTQAEAIADLINAESEAAAKSAVQSLKGAFSEKVEQLVEQIIQLRMYVEAAIDFPEEEVDFLSDGKIKTDLNQIIQQIEHVQQQASQGSILREGMRVVIAGKPNAGKSSLLNQLAGKQTAIVTDIAGTTRDTIKEHIHIDGMPLHIIDTAGLRDSDDKVEQIGIQRAWEEINQADRIVIVTDSTETLIQSTKDLPDAVTEKLPDNIGITLVRNKIDLLENRPERASEQQDIYDISANSGEGIDQLKQHLKQCMGFEQASEGQFIARSRHVNALSNAYHHLMTGKDQLEAHLAGELLAEELRLSQQFLDEITGRFTSDDLLGKIFSSFCIGK